MLGGKRKRTFIVTPTIHQAYLEAAPEPLKTIEIFGVEDGLRLEEMVSLAWPQVHMENKPDADGLYGYLKIVRGKSENAKRTFPITAVMHEVLVQQKKISRSAFVFVRRDGKTPFQNGSSTNGKPGFGRSCTSPGMPPFTLSVIALPLAWD